jgi:hypothetical protein
MDTAAYKKAHAEGMLALVDGFQEPDRTLVKKACRQIIMTSLPLYIQALITFETLHSIINHAPLYFVQRQPQELGTFTWIVDGKEPVKITNWEMWWSWYAHGALSTMSRRRPAPRLKGADYSFYDRFKGESDGEEGIDTNLLLANLRFSSTVKPGLELVDIVVNATRRALVGSLGEIGWRGIPRLMVHRKEPYIKFISLRQDGSDMIRHPSYARVVRQFSTGGRVMLAPRFLHAARDKATVHKAGHPMRDDHSS